ncbi:MAG: hypothetical protein PHW10_04720 [Candidatus Peribacteraceae bacterium]|nr:hypothetical protein [Candidatus Peribacteraceae bacterium]
MTNVASLLPAVLLLLLSADGPARAQETAPQQSFDVRTPCATEINRALNKERFLFESALFGIRPAREERTGASRVDWKGNIWIKTESNSWATSGGPDGDITKSNGEMDEETAPDPLAPDTGIDPSEGRTGILQTQRALTSDIIPPLLQSFRAFQCRALTVCEAADKATGSPKKDGDSASQSSLQAIGCRPMDPAPLPLCRPTPVWTFVDTVAMRSYCAPVAEELIRYEESLLGYLAHEDAAHRSLRQFGGNFEPILRMLDFSFLTPLDQASQFLGRFSRLPCFLPYCAPAQP